MAIQIREVTREQARECARSFLRRNHGIVVPKEFRPSLSDVDVVKAMLDILV